MLQQQPFEAVRSSTKSSFSRYFPDLNNRNSNWSSQRQKITHTIKNTAAAHGFTHTQTQQRKRPHSEYKSWQFGNWAFGLMEPPRQHPEPDDRKRDLNKRAEYWGGRRCRQGYITVKMQYKHRVVRRTPSPLPYLLQILAQSITYRRCGEKTNIMKDFCLGIIKLHIPWGAI